MVLKLIKTNPHLGDPGSDIAGSTCLLATMGEPGMGVPALLPPSSVIGFEIVLVTTCMCSANCLMAPLCRRFVCFTCAK